jgi:hypothetical protein
MVGRGSRLVVAFTGKVVLGFFGFDSSSFFSDKNPPHYEILWW